MVSRDELQSRHGTPSEFENAVWKACADLFITVPEAVAAIRKYNEEWDTAPQSPPEPATEEKK